MFCCYSTRAVVANAGKVARFRALEFSIGWSKNNILKATSVKCRTSSYYNMCIVRDIDKS